MIVLDEMLELKLYNFNRGVKMKPEIINDHKIIVDMSNDLWFRNDEIDEERSTRVNAEQKDAQLEALTLRKKTGNKLVAGSGSSDWRAGSG